MITSSQVHHQPSADELLKDLHEKPEAEAPMAPTSPDGFRLGGEPPRVMRLSRKALATLGVAASVAIGGSLIYALQPKSPVPPENLFDTNSRNRADQVTGAPANYSDVPKLASLIHDARFQTRSGHLLPLAVLRGRPASLAFVSPRSD